MNNKKLKQLVKEALSNMIEEETETENEVEITVNINGEEQELDEIDSTDLGNKNLNTAISANELYSSIDDTSDSGGSIITKSITSKAGETTTQADDHYRNVEEMDMGGGTLDKDAEILADLIDSIPDSMGGEEEIFPLHEFFGMDEMAKSANVYRLIPGKEAALIRLFKLTNQKLKDRSRSTGTQGTKAKPFTDDDLERIIDVISQGEFTTNDLKAAHQNTSDKLYRKSQPGPQLWNGILNKQPKIDKETGKPIPKTGGVLTDLGYVELTSQLKKQMEPDTSAEPKRRGRPPAPKPPSPEDEFDAPEMEPEMAPDDDPVVQQATQAQAQAQDPKKQAVKAFMDRMKSTPSPTLTDENGEPIFILSADNKVLDVGKYKDEFANAPELEKFRPTTNETLNENKTMKKQLLQERFQQLAGIKPMYAINELNLGQKTLGVINRAKSFVKGLFPSADGAEIKQGLKDSGYSTTGLKMYSASSLPDSNISPEYRLGTADLSDEDLRKKVKVNQNQIDEGSMDTVFQAAVVAFDLNQNIPKLIAKVYYLNFSTGKYDFIQTKEEDLSPEDLRQHSDIDANRIKKETQQLKSISIGDLRKRVRAVN